MTKKCYDCGTKLDKEYVFATRRNRCGVCWSNKYGKVNKEKEIILTRIFKKFFGLLINPWKKQKEG